MTVTVLTFDPSSTRTGYAIMTGLARSELVNAGYLAPFRPRDTPVVRIAEMARAVEELVDEFSPAVIVVEISTRGRRTRHAGEVVYGMAAGAMLAAAVLFARDGRVATVEANLWTQGITKIRRQLLIGGLYPAYKPHLRADSGGDVGDAIGIGLWFFRTGRVDYLDIGVTTHA